MCDLYLLMQIFLESLPISSSGHLDLLGLSAPWAVDFFAHGPTVLMLGIYFMPDMRRFFNSVRCSWGMYCRLFSVLILAECFTPLFYVLFSFVLPRPPLWAGLFCTMLLLFSLRLVPRPFIESVGRKELLWIGMVQGIALLPGVSRLASTYTVGRWMGLSAASSFRLSCALQVPLFAGGALLGTFSLWRKNELAPFLMPSCLFGMFVAAVGAFFLLKCVEKSMQSERLWILGFYMVIPVVAAFFLR